MKNFMNKPITWGSYMKLCGVSMLFGMATTAYTWYKLYK